MDLDIALRSDENHSITGSDLYDEIKIFWKILSYNLLSVLMIFINLF